MTFDMKAARAILSTMSPLPWIVLEDENGQMTIIRNPNHPMHRDGMEAWGRKEASETPDAMGIAYMRENFGAALDEIERLQATRSQELADAVDGERDRWLYDYQKQAKRIADLESLAPEHPDFEVDFKALEHSSNLLAWKWIKAYRKAQNSNVIRMQWCEQKDRIIAELEAEVLQQSVTASSLATECNSLKKHVAALEREEHLWRYQLHKGEVDLVLKTEKQRAALKKLGEAKRARGKALVEERKLRMQLDASRFGMGIPEETAIARSRKQLRQEGKLR